jgi:2-amino-4-hydroxy-6-hydroxymethyldihydropteridine diphosphokinase
MIIIALGSNLPGRFGTPKETLSRALAEMSASGVEIASTSRLYRTLAYASIKQPDFLNAVAAVSTSLSAEALLQVLKRIEAQAGRRAAKNADPTALRWAPRTLDLDLIDYDSVIYNWKMRSPANGERVILPHPRAHERVFVLRPVCDIAPLWRHPVFGLTARQLLQRPGVSETGRIVSAGGFLASERRALPSPCPSGRGNAG